MHRQAKNQLIRTCWLVSCKIISPQQNNFLLVYRHGKGGGTGGGGGCGGVGEGVGEAVHSFTIIYNNNDNYLSFADIMMTPKEYFCHSQENISMPFSQQCNVYHCLSSTPARLHR